MDINRRLSTGVNGLDEVLLGGLIERRAYLVRGGPGQGKTTLGLHFLTAAAADEPTLFIGFQEPEEQLRSNAAAMGIDLSRVDILCLTPEAQFFTEQQSYDVFSSADVEQGPLVEQVVAAVERHRPVRVFVDSLTQLRFLSSDIFQYRKLVLSFLRFLSESGATVLFTSEHGADLSDDDLQFMADGVINLESDPSGSAICVSKLRGSGFRRGLHHMRISNEGLRVYPRMTPPTAKVAEEERKVWNSGVPELDEMLRGGLEAGTVSLITGPSGIGKSTLSSMFVADAARKGRKAAVYLFEEERSIYLRRARTLNIDLDTALKQDLIQVEQVEPLRYMADEFTMQVRQRVEEEGLDVVVLDSVAGFELTLEGEGVRTRLHAFAKSLARMGVTVLLVNEVELMTGEFRISERGISYLSDNVIFLRYMEVDGQLRKAIGILKKRLSGFSNTMRSYEIEPPGIVVGEPIHGMRGILQGAPTPQEPM